MSRSLSRQELYDLVWSKPLNRLAEDLEVSDVGLAKLCDRLGVPRPPRGYWIKKEYGQPVEVLPLPQGNYPASHTIRPIEASSRPRSEALQTLKQRESAPKNKIVVPSTLNNPHPWIAAARKEYDNHAKQTGLIGLIGHNSPDLCTTYALAPRTLVIFNTLLRALKERNIAVRLEAGRTWVAYEGESLQIGLREKSSRRYYTPAEKADLKTAGTYSWYTPPNFMDIPNGMLSLFIREEQEFYNGYSRTVDERPSRPLEHRINEMIVALARMAEAVKARRREREAREIRWAEEAAQREAQEELKRIEQRRMKKFTEWADNWYQACQLTAFLQAMENLLDELPPDHEARAIHGVAQTRLLAMNPLTNHSIRNLRVSEYGQYRED